MSSAFKTRARLNFQNVYRFRNKHEGESCILLGNGPSLLQWYERLPELSERHTIIGINRSWRDEDGHAIYTAPYHVVFGHLHGAEIVAGLHDPPLVFTNKSCVISLQGWTGQVVAVDNRGDWNRQRFQFDIDRGTGAPFAGVFALQVAAWMGFGEIYLVGHDLNARDGHHWKPGSDGYNRAPSAKNFEGAATWAKQSGTKVLNANPDSAIRCFPFDEPE